MIRMMGIGEMTYQEFKARYAGTPITDRFLTHMWNRFSEDLAIKFTDNTKKAYLLGLEEKKEKEYVDITDF